MDRPGLVSRLVRAERQLRRRLLGLRLFVFLAFILFSLPLWAILALLLPEGLRLILLVFFLPVAGSGLVWVMFPVLGPVDPRRAAARTESEIEEWQGWIRPAVGLELAGPGELVGTSAALSKEAVERAGRLVRPASAPALFPRTWARTRVGLDRAVRSASVALGLNLAVMAVAPEPAHHALQAVGLLPVPDLPPALLAVYPGSRRLKAGEDLRILVVSDREGFEEPRLTWERDGRPWGEGRLLPVTGGVWERTFQGVWESFSYVARHGDVASDTFRVSVDEPLQILEVRMTVTPPIYVGQPPETLVEPPATLTIPSGTKLELQIRTSAPARLRVEFDGHGSQSVPLSGERDWLHGRFIPRGFGTLCLLTSEGESLRSYRVTTIPDRPPAVKLLAPPDGKAVGESMTERVALAASDDYGLSQVAMDVHLWREGRERKTWTEELARLAPAVPETVMAYPWDLQGLALLPGDELLYRIVAWDNDELSGPKRGESPFQVLRVPTLVEMLAGIDALGDEALRGLRSASRQAQELGHALTEAHWAMEKGVEGFDLRQVGREVLERQEGLEVRLEEIGRILEAAATALEQFGPLDPALEAKMAEVARLVRDVTSPELQVAVKALARALAEANPEGLRRGLRGLLEAHQELESRLDRTLSLLRRMQVQQKLGSLRSLAQRLAERESRVAEGAMGGDALEVLQGKHREVEEGADRLRAGLEAASRSFRELGEEELARLLEELAATKGGEEFGAALNQVAAALQDGQRARAGHLAGEASQLLSRLGEQLAGMGMALEEEWREETVAALEAAVGDLLLLSTRQEALMHRLARLGKVRGPGSAGLVERQVEITDGIRVIQDRLQDIGRQTVFLSPRAQQSVSWSESQAQELLPLLQDRLASTDRTQALGRQVFGGLNAAAFLLMRDVRAAGQSAGGMGLDETMARLRELAEGQGQLNGETEGLWLVVEGQLGIELGLQERLLGLAQEQQRLAEALRELGGGLGEREAGRIMGRLDRLGREAEEIAQALQEGRLSQEILERQREVLDRLLSAQRSLQERGTEERRRSEVGREAPRTPPPGTVDGDAGSWEAWLDQWEGRYPTGYGGLIGEYFRQLQRLQRGGHQ